MTRSTNLTRSGFRSGLFLVDSVGMLPAFLIVVLYLMFGFDLTASAWRALGVALILFVGLSATGSYPLRMKMIRSILAWVDHREAQAGSESPTKLPPQQVREAFADVIALPSRVQRIDFLTSCSVVVLIPLTMRVLGEQGWGLGARLSIFSGIAVAAAFFSSHVVFYFCKEWLLPYRAAIAGEILDPMERESLITRVPLSRKVPFAIASAVIAALMVVAGLSYARAGAVVEGAAIEWQQKAVDRLAELDPALPFEERVEIGLADERVWPVAASFFEVDLARSTESDDPGRVAFERLVQLAVDGGKTAGWIAEEGLPLVGAFHAIGGDRVLVGMADRASLRRGLGGFAWMLVGLVVFAALLSVGIGILVSNEVGRGAAALQAEAERMAHGDLRRGAVYEAEDELGDLFRAFERMGGALRATVARVAEAADRVEAASAEITSVSASVSTASADQVRRIQQATELMGTINQQVVGVADSAQALNVSVEESSSSILELGAAGDELNDTASVLSEKVEEVSSSIEEMVRSVKAVTGTTEHLANAAAETSSSMEEMASAMRAVDNTAELTASLSRDMVSSAESGQAKVSQTMEGMQAIRDATDAAEHVIRGLGTQAKEIGGILDVIDDVADETNLLALNAAIIAAQAGEHGRAFSVVADEIKELADRVLASTKEIGSLIRSVQEESDNAIGAIEAGSHSVASGVELSAEAGASLEEITSAARESGERIAEIVNAVREQTRATAHVVNLMEKVSESVDQIAGAGEEQDRGNEIVYRSVMTMREVAQQVRRTTEEQARGFGRIRESVEGVRVAVETINASLQEQTLACGKVGEFLEQVFDGTRSNEDAAQRMGESMRGLVAQAEALREDVGRFRI